MSQSIIARRYAKALYEQAETTGATESADADVRLLQQTLRDSRELRQLFASPVVSRERKKAVVRALFLSRVSELSVRFVELLIDKKREGLFIEVADAYGSLRDEQMGIMEIAVRSARPMTAIDEEVVTVRMEQVTGKKVRVVTTVDPSLMGGIQVRVGDTVYDGSISGRLISLRERLMQGVVSVN